MAELRLVDRADHIPGAGEGVVRRVRGQARKISFVFALVVAGVALAIGSGVGSSAPPTLAQRAAALDAQIKCPSCDDISVAQSTASSALAVRHEVSTLLAAGESDQAVENRLVAQYGSSILLAPPKSGLSLVLWVLPIAAAALVLAALGWFFWRRSRSWHSWRRLRATGRESPT